MEYLLIGFLLLGAYLVGSIPSGYWIAKYWFKVDVTKKGSGNIGATNVSRVLNSKKLFFLIFFLDAAKAFTWLWFSAHLLMQANVSDTVLCNVLMAAGVVLLIGNAHSIFLHFSGGKGVAAAVGIFAALAPLLALIFIAIWFLSLAIWRRADLSSLLATMSLLASYFFVGYVLQSAFFLFTIFIVCWIFWRHKTNIASMLK